MQIQGKLFFAPFLLGLALILPRSTDAGAVSNTREPPSNIGSSQEADTSNAGFSTRPNGREEIPLHPEVQQLRGELEAILTSTGNRQGRWGVLAISLDRHDTILSLNPREMMVPASNMKLLTTAAAFHYLGPDFRYRTFLLEDGTRSGEVLDGDLVLFGTGDPTLSDRFFGSETAPMDTLAEKVVRAGIREIRGNLVVDGSFFGGQDLHSDWDPDDLNDAFAAPVSAASLNENILRVRVEAGSWVGAQPTVHTFPPGSGIPIYNVAKTVAAGARSRIWLLREVFRNPVEKGAGGQRGPGNGKSCAGPKGIGLPSELPVLTSDRSPHDLAQSDRNPHFPSPPRTVEDHQQRKPQSLR